MFSFFLPGVSVFLSLRETPTCNATHTRRIVRRWYCHVKRAQNHPHVHQHIYVSCKTGHTSLPGTQEAPRLNSARSAMRSTLFANPRSLRAAAKHISPDRHVSAGLTTVPRCIVWRILPPSVWYLWCPGTVILLLYTRVRDERARVESNQFRQRKMKYTIQVQIVRLLQIRL